MRSFVGWWVKRFSFAATRLLLTACAISAHLQWGYWIFLFALFFVDGTASFFLGVGFRHLPDEERRELRHPWNVGVFLILVGLIALDIGYLVYAGAHVLAMIGSLLLAYLACSFNSVLERQ
ncbi:hypothetical protein BcepSauron_124 [Burkholderia phage BcepSauron]|uniref:Uncharacterized protein n=2 Tax=Sarumanvirus TaxID=2843450 RepID=A0A482ML57_9CAUD|nr:hypothetical protein H1O16_gp125 [Burkholderia phage BcepSaruman]YP_009904502.1 hypothetical protein H1O17_gp124 [Burkholderia phage BcepSauron]QBQ74504.1 hypothetical protein BcepSauron_124 [Burkholderia phage BcepSauron]QBX06538.1 hypothetical protein BcepSaruman_125 [Burkholderia phage BcepSaruman]